MDTRKRGQEGKKIKVKQDGEVNQSHNDDGRCLLITSACLRGCVTQSACAHTTTKTDNRPTTGKQSTGSKFRDRMTKHSSSPFSLFLKLHLRT